jgi:hypothetical protein
MHLLNYCHHGSKPLAVHAVVFAKTCKAFPLGGHVMAAIEQLAGLCIRIHAHLLLCTFDKKAISAGA